MHPLEKAYVQLAQKAAEKKQVQKEVRAWKRLLKTFPDSHYRVQAHRRLYALRLRQEQKNNSNVARHQTKPAHSVSKHSIQRQNVGKPSPTSASKLQAPSPKISTPAPNPTVLGIILPRSGRAAPLGEYLTRSITLALRTYPQLKIVYMDSYTSAEKSAQAVDTLVYRHKAIAILGPPLSRTAKAAAQRAQKLGVPFLSISKSEGLTDIGAYIFRNNFSLSMMGRAIAQYSMQKLHIRKYGILYPQSPYGQIQAKAFFKEIKRLGGTVTKQIAFAPKSKDFQKPLRQLIGDTYENKRTLRLNRTYTRGLKAYQRKRLRKKLRGMLKPLLSFEGLFIPEDARTVSQIMPYFSHFNVQQRTPTMRTSFKSNGSVQGFRRIQLLGNNSWYNRKLFRVSRRHMRGGLFCVRFDPQSKDKATRNFIRQYRSQFRKSPIHIDAYMYDSIRILAQVATERQPQTREGFRDALSQIKAHRGPTGPVHFRKNGDAVSPIRCLTAYPGYFRAHGIFRLQ